MSDPLKDASITSLANVLLENQAGIQIDYLVDHGWQVQVSNPGGSLFVHEYDGEDKWRGLPHARTLAGVIARAIRAAEEQGWW